MIKEDYVSFEVALLLTTKGFPALVDSHKHYAGKGGVWIEDFDKPTPDFKCGELIYNPFHQPTDGIEIDAPTLQMTIKWLREEHHLCIFLIPSYVDQNFHHDYALYPVCNGEWEWCASKNDGSKAKFGYDVNNKYYETYEEAANAVIKYCLENLI